MSAQPDQATESMLQQMHESMLKACEGMVKIPADCFALIRLPISIPDFASFSRICERMSPNCVARQCGEFLLISHAEKKPESQP